MTILLLQNYVDDLQKRGGLHLDSDSEGDNPAVSPVPACIAKGRHNFTEMKLGENGTAGDFEANHIMLLMELKKLISPGDNSRCTPVQALKLPVPQDLKVRRRQLFFSALIFMYYAHTFSMSSLCCALVTEYYENRCSTKLSRLTPVFYWEVLLFDSTI